MESKNRYCAFFRVDANKIIGSGHLVRCRLLAGKLKSMNVKSVFVFEDIPEGFITQLSAENFDLYKLKNTLDETNELISLVKNSGCEKSIIITDSDKKLFYTKEFQLKVRESGIKLMTITFFADAHFYSDIILNQNIMAPELTYSTESYTEKLLGTEYVILDPRFAKLRNIAKPVWALKKNVVLISFGGADKPDRTSLVYESLQEFKDKIDKIIIVLGALYQHENKIRKLASESLIETGIYQNTNEMPQLMIEAKYAFTSGGLTAWELAVTRTLNIIIAGSERETLTGEYLGKKGFSYYLGNVNDIKPENIKYAFEEILINEEKNKAMVEKLNSVVNVNGIEKVTDKILEILER